MKFLFSLLIASLLVFLSKSLDTNSFETNILNLQNEEDEESMRLKSVACLYILNLRYDYNKEFVEMNLRQSPHEDKAKLYDKLLFIRLKYCLAQISFRNATFITFNLNNDKSINDANLYYLIESGEKEEEILVDMDQSLDLDEEEQAIKKYITSAVNFQKNELIPEQQPEIIQQEEFKKKAEQKMQQEIEKMEKNQQQQEASAQQAQKQQQSQENSIDQIKQIIQSIMKDENFKIYLGLVVGLFTGIVYAYFSSGNKKKAEPEPVTKKSQSKQDKGQAKATGKDTKKEQQETQKQQSQKSKKSKKNQ